jgi:hypothetical protein
VATRYTFTDDSDDVRLSGFLTPEPASSTFPVNLVGSDPAVDDLLLIDEPAGYAAQSNTGNVIRVNDGVTDLFMVDAYGDVNVIAPVGQGAAQLSLKGADGDHIEIASSGSIGGTQGVRILSNVGFYNTTPVTQPVVPLTLPSVQDVIDALVTLGLVSQSD